MLKPLVILSQMRLSCTLFTPGSQLWQSVNCLHSLSTIGKHVHHRLKRCMRMGPRPLTITSSPKNCVACKAACSVQSTQLKLLAERCWMRNVGNKMRQYVFADVCRDGSGCTPVSTALNSPASSFASSTPLSPQMLASDSNCTAPLIKRHPLHMHAL